MSWITQIPYEKATGKLRQLYDRIKGPNDNVDNIMMAHSLRPHSMLGHMHLYKNVLHHRDNTLPKWYLECIGVYVSQLNHCEYCVQHHAAGLKRLLADDARYHKMIEGFEQVLTAAVFTEKDRAGLTYALQLSRSPQEMSRESIIALQNAGFSEGEIVELNQVISYFHYANRTVLGLGVSLEGDIIGLSPHDSDDSENWSHS
ncbi:MAG: carboxymuconolactone decarboxylase family protein [Bacteroidia bacterium]